MIEYGLESIRYLFVLYAMVYFTALVFLMSSS